ncbi:MAG: RagB/SusD family nutrient uptake outer membrane protein [Carboxylicivirga sp.]|jgi:hypothetical protein|nr:RagB/SusD family nutrient uptake outer membrane protein [Carboxylicivirga sp.]
MKIKALSLLILTIGCLTLGGCSDFLDVRPRNLKIVKTPSEHKAILAGYLRWCTNVTSVRDHAIMGGGFHFLSPKMSVYCGETSRVAKDLTDPETGLINPQVQVDYSWLHKNVNKWKQNYAFTGQLNYIIDNITEVEDDIEISQIENDAIRDYVKGEALVWRAWTLYNILQFYSPYKNNELGIVLNMTHYVDPINAVLKRSSQLACYKQILSDCNTALELLQRTPTTDWNVLYESEFIYGMMANVFMYKAMSGAAETNDWSNAEKYANLAIGNRELSADPSSLRRMFDMQTVPYEKYHSSQFTRRIVKTTPDFIEFSVQGYVGNNMYSGMIVPGLESLYKENDIRKSIYFFKHTAGLMNNKYNMYGLGDPGQGGIVVPFRLAENILIKAEALCRQNKDSEASEVLNYFKEKRYTSYDVAETPANHDGLLEEILLQRRLEFFHEGDIRWLDMKRLGLELDRGKIAGIDIKLEANDYRYTWPIPLLEMDSRHDVVQNPGWENIMFEE